jgi:hypothetical protein
MIKGAVMSALITAGVGAGGYAAWEGMLLAGDNRYIRQDVYRETVNDSERRRIQREIDELEFIMENERQLTDREKWQLKRLKSDKREIK